jgi:hypothetical protein
MLNGAGNLKGWGQNPFPDQSLLYVRGFDPATQRYRYEVNQRFGATRPQFLTLRSPVMLTASIRIDLGPTRERQTLMPQLSAISASEGRGGRGAGQFLRAAGANSLANPLAAILMSQDSLELTSLQADSIASMNRRYTYRADSLWAPVAAHFASLPQGFSENEAYRQYLGARRAQIDMLKVIGPAVHDLLTSAQRRKLPARVTSYLDPLYLASIRDGTGTYIGGPSLGGGGGGGFGGGFGGGGFGGGGGGRRGG